MCHLSKDIRGIGGSQGGARRHGEGNGEQEEDKRHQKGRNSLDHPCGTTFLVFAWDQGILSSSGNQFLRGLSTGNENGDSHGRTVRTFAEGIAGWMRPRQSPFLAGLRLRFGAGFRTMEDTVRSGPNSFVRRRISGYGVDTAPGHDL